MAVWLSWTHTHTHVHICITTPGRRLFTCQVKGLKSVTDGDLTRKAGAGEENEYAERLQCEGLEQKLKQEWQYKVEGGGLELGLSQNYERVKCHKCHVSRPHKDKLCIAPEVKAYTDAPVSNSWGLFEWMEPVSDAEFSLFSLFETTGCTKINGVPFLKGLEWNSCFVSCLQRMPIKEGLVCHSSSCLLPFVIFIVCVTLVQQYGQFSSQFSSHMKKQKICIANPILSWLSSFAAGLCFCYPFTSTIQSFGLGKEGPPVGNLG